MFELRHSTNVLTAVMYENTSFTIYLHNFFYTLVKFSVYDLNSWVAIKRILHLSSS